MKNKGFTLIELIVTIALIAAISVAVGISMSGMLSRQDEKQMDEYIATIEKAACTYAEINNITTNSSVKISSLISSGLLKKDLTNPNTKENITYYNDDVVNITWENYEKKCIYPQENE